MLCDEIAWKIESPFRNGRQAADKEINEEVSENHKPADIFGEMDFQHVNASPVWKLAHSLCNYCCQITCWSIHNFRLLRFADIEMSNRLHMWRMIADQIQPRSYCLKLGQFSKMLNRQSEEINTLQVRDRISWSVGMLFSCVVFDDHHTQLLSYISHQSTLFTTSELLNSKDSWLQFFQRVLGSSFKGHCFCAYYPVSHDIIMCILDMSVICCVYTSQCCHRNSSRFLSDRQSWLTIGMQKASVDDIY